MERRVDRRPGRLFELGTRWLVALGLAGAAWTVLGQPQLGQVADFFASRDPSFTETLSALQVMIWVLVGLTLLWTVIGLVRMAASGVSVWRPQRLWGGAVLTVGILILLAGLSHHQSASTVSLGSGSLAEAKGLLDR
ncbi:MAG: hypothetical protein JF888_02995 [Candidatus Dormibacteraeota bacterium]|uniref:Uncharacterized protein n=1 Tax=Candidatus Dormiibacter inghamiae TaxID=3127013 RepID=A0A934NGH3_9BACT|nr:hypothetical protein [Candidatus Dormibacteraeota bacterium]MBJ7605599.1 hypothetical protein [Candidatus Dormibacteraeota bacterium]